MIKPVINCPPDWCVATFPKMLRYQHIFDTRDIQVVEDFPVNSKTIGPFTVPAGFMSDGASVPRILWSVFPAYGKYLESAVPHDFGYVHLCLKYPKEVIDKLFRELLEAQRIPEWKIKLMYRGVKLGGKGGWD